MSGAAACAYGNRFGGNPNYTPSASLTTPTYDASGVTTEPTWRLKPSWVTAVGTDLLAHNPITGGSSTVENPSLLISNDNGSTWTTPPGLTNPIAGPPATANYADCNLLVDPNTNQLVMTWLWQGAITPNTNAGIYYSICTAANLVTWSAPTQLISDSAQQEQEPKIVWDAKRGRYLLFSCDAGGAGTLWVRISTGTNPVGTYGSRQTCSLPMPTTDKLWHMDIQQEPSGRFVMVFCDSHNPGVLARQGWIASSWDGINWKVAPRPFMKANTWATDGVYRPSLQPARTGSGYDLITAKHQDPDAHMGLVRNIPATEIP